MAIQTLPDIDSSSSTGNSGVFAADSFPASFQQREPVPAAGKILIVDSSVSRKLQIRQLFGTSGHKLFDVNSTEEAITALKQDPIDLVLIDRCAAGVGANDFCRALRKDAGTRFLPVFVLAETPDFEDEVKAIEAGANEFLARPFHAQAFLARVQANLQRKALIDMLDDAETVIFTLAKSVEDRDPDLSMHCQRLALMGAAMGLALNLPANDVLALQRGGFLHDIGKISIPDRVLFKTGPLTPEEWAIMKSHPERGERICAGIKSLTSVLPIIRSHHERWDGSGYPDGLKGQEIPLLARVLQFADIYDALTTLRPYKHAFTSDEALAILAEETAKGWRDPAIFRVFSEILPMFHASSLPDFSRLSLAALAASVESFRQRPPVADRRFSNAIKLAG